MMALSSVPPTSQQMFDVVVSSRDQNCGTGSSMDFLKRPLLQNGHRDSVTESDCEQDAEPAAKMRCGGGSASGMIVGGGGGRRKQSKPIRLRADIEEDLAAAVALSPSALDSSPSMCRDRSPMVDALALTTDPVDAEPAMTARKDDEPSPSDDVFPTKYHQLGSELKQGAEHSSYSDMAEMDADRPNMGSSPRGLKTPDAELVKHDRHSSIESASDPESPPRQQEGSRIKENEAIWNEVQSRLAPGFFANPHDSRLADFQRAFLRSTSGDGMPADLSVRSESLLDTMNRRLSTNALSEGEMMRFEALDAERAWDGGIEKSRIFHPDAYCNICDREFCNKYFLKTHRANKHGIYDGNENCPVGSSNVPVSGNSSLPTLPPLPQQQQHYPDPPPLVTTTSTAAEQLQQHHEPSTPIKSSAASAMPNLPLSNLLPVPQLPPNLGMMSFEEACPMPPRNADMEDYCDICQKHFCNKYYLRKHRQDVHGLSTTEAAKRPSANVNSSPDFNHDDVSAALRSGFGPPPRFPIPPSSGAGSMPGLGNFMFLPPFANPLVMMPPFLQAGGLGFGPGAPGSLPLPRAPMADNDIKPSTNVQFSPDSSTSSSQMPAVAAAAAAAAASNSVLPGLLNAEACLELYQKELMKFNRYLMNGENNPASAFNASSDEAANAATNAAARFMNLAAGRPDAPSRHGTASDRPEMMNDTFAEMLQRIGSRFGAKPDGYDNLTQELMRMNGLGFDPSASFPGMCPTSTPSSRLVDRVVCDICNKEVCNKYFLKTHKMKVHGWDPNSVSAAPTSTSDCSPVKSEPAVSAHLDQNSPPHATQPSDRSAFSLSDKMRGKDVDLQQMGIDPEAYCDICRKEFCSKYFLRTHRQNIHGIRDTSRASSPGGLMSTQLPQSLPPSSLFLGAGVTPQLLQNIPLSMPQQQMSLPPTTMSISSSSFPLYATADSNSGDGLSSEQRSWKWKEPVNATRVSCQLCNKVLCNKYFLRTHMAKRHGIGMDTRLPPPSSQLLPGSVIKDEGGRVIQEYQMPPTLSASGLPSSLPSSSSAAPNNPSSFMSHSHHFDGMISDIKKEISPDSKSNSNTGGAINLVVSGRSSASLNDSQTVTARTWQVPSSEDSSSTPTNDVPCSNNNNIKPFSGLQREPGKCPMCGAVFAGNDTLLMHLATVHQVTPDSGEDDAHRTAAPSSAPTTPSNTGVPHLSPLSSSAGSIRRRRQFRCAHCRERFRTRVHCELHARAAHPRSTAACIEVAGPRDTDHRPRSTSAIPTSPAANLKSGLSGVPPAPIYATPLDNADPSRFCMQPFILQESTSASSGSETSAAACPPRFSTSLVYLPTLRPITEPTSVTFTLTPIMQP